MYLLEGKCYRFCYFHIDEILLDIGQVVIILNILWQLHNFYFFLVHVPFIDVVWVKIYKHIFIISFYNYYLFKKWISLHVSDHLKGLIFLIFRTFTCLGLWTCACHIACMWMPGDSLQELALSLHHMDTGDWTQVIRLENKYIYTLSHLAGLVYNFFVLFVCVFEIGDIGMIPRLALKLLESSYPLVLTFQIAGTTGIKVRGYALGDQNLASGFSDSSCDSAVAFS